MATIYRRTNLLTKETKEMPWEEASELDKRIWSEPEEVKGQSQKSRTRKVLATPIMFERGERI